MKSIIIIYVGLARICFAQFALEHDAVLGNSVGSLTTELHTVCSTEDSKKARCGPGAHCLLLGGVPTCHCIVDNLTGIRLAGNPYRGCTWDISGVWELTYVFKQNVIPYKGTFSSEPFIFSIKRTDAVLKTKYMTGNIFVVSANTAAATGLVHRAFVNVDDNVSVIFETAEGFVDKSGRSMFLRHHANHQSLMKRFPKKAHEKDILDLRGGWKKINGSKVKLHKFKQKGFNSFVVTTPNAYWYNEDTHGIPHVRLSTALFLDETLPFEKNQFSSDDRFIQLGWYGRINKGVSTISIISPADGRVVFHLTKVSEFPTDPPLELKPTVITVDDFTSIDAVQQAAEKSLGDRKLSEKSAGPVFFGPDIISSIRRNERQLKDYPKGKFFEENEVVNEILNQKIENELSLELASEIDDQNNFESDLLQKTDTELMDLSYIEPVQRFLQGLFDKIIGTEAAKSLNRVVGPESAVEKAVFTKTEFFGLDYPEDTPYDYLFVHPSNKLQDVDHTNDTEFRQEIQRDPTRRS